MLIFSDKIEFFNKLMNYLSIGLVLFIRNNYDTYIHYVITIYQNVNDFLILISGQ